MKDISLTIGMATYDDFHGVYFTTLALSTYQNLLPNTEILIVDNNPNSSHGKACKEFCTKIGASYFAKTEKNSTSIRDYIFKKAKGDYTLCMDCHVLLSPNAIQKLMQYYNRNPDTKDIISGPLLSEKQKIIATHMDLIWQDHMYGVWGIDKRVYERIPFEIPAMGLGLFSCKTSNWPGFNENFIGFGGEEGYIHEKFRRNGGKAICLPGLEWHHRFPRPDGVKYPLILEDRIFNYFVGWLELTKDPKDQMIDSIFNHFKSLGHDIQIIDRCFIKAKQIYGY